VPEPYPSEFRDDVVRVARNRESGVTIEQIAKDFGIHPMTLQKWLRRADVDEGAKPGQTRIESVENRELRKRVRLLDQENEVLRLAAVVSVAGEPAGKRLYPLVTELAVTVTCRVLKLARQPYYRWLAEPITETEVTEAYRANALFDAHRDDPEFGHRLLADEAATPVR
jgi:putative transposase